MAKIKFLTYKSADSYKYLPIPARDALPEWFISTKLYNGNIATIKICPAINDILRSGYIIRLEDDLHINVNRLDQSCQADRANKMALPSHPVEQFDKCPHHNKLSAFKFKIPFNIITEPGYSCLYLDPWMHTNQDFTISEGVIDTDKFHANMNIIAMSNRNTSFTIPEGTPIVQIIPFKREEWEYEIIQMSLNDAELVNEFSSASTDPNTTMRKSSFYINNYHSKKSFK